MTLPVHRQHEFLPKCGQPNRLLKKSFPTVAGFAEDRVWRGNTTHAVSSNSAPFDSARDRRNAEENNGAALIERRYRAFFQQAAKQQEVSDE